MERCCNRLPLIPCSEGRQRRASSAPHHDYQFVWAPAGFPMTGVLSFCRREVRLQRGVFRSVPELIAAIEQYIATHNQNPKPFVWTAKANDISLPGLRLPSS